MADIIAQPFEKKDLWFPKGFFSSPERTRTSNLAVNSRPLCQLSYQGRQVLIIGKSWLSVKHSNSDFVENRVRIRHYKRLSFGYSRLQIYRLKVKPRQTFGWRGSSIYFLFSRRCKSRRADLRHHRDLLQVPCRVQHHRHRDPYQHLVQRRSPRLCQFQCPDPCRPDLNQRLYLEPYHIAGLRHCHHAVAVDRGYRRHQGHRFHHQDRSQVLHHHRCHHQDRN